MLRSRTVVSTATYEHELAISAVAYDTLLVRDLGARVAGRINGAPAWSGASSSVGLTGTPLHDRTSRVVVVLHQRLWGHDPVTAGESAIIEDRARRKAGSVVVVSLDDEPLASWMAGLPTCELARVGVTGVADFLLDAVASAGGIVEAGSIDSAALESPDARVLSRWPEPPTPFLGQPRAHGGLRRELDILCDTIESRFAALERSGGEHVLELQKTPNRFMARVDDVGVTFSWVGGRVGTVADGRLMVIEWHALAGKRGVIALQKARAARERVYVAEASGSDDWCWRADGPHGRASSTVNLVGEWMDGAAMAGQANAIPGCAPMADAL